MGATTISTIPNAQLVAITSTSGIFFSFKTIFVIVIINIVTSTHDGPAIAEGGGVHMRCVGTAPNLSGTSAEVPSLCGLTVGLARGQSVRLPKVSSSCRRFMSLHAGHVPRLCRPTQVAITVSLESLASGLPYRNRSFGTTSRRDFKAALAKTHTERAAFDSRASLAV